jgi:hypothetical protein
MKVECQKVYNLKEFGNGNESPIYCPSKERSNKGKEVNAQQL